MHVASVVQMTHMLLCHGGVMKSQALSMRQQMATYFSALVHDFEHGGVNNDFLVQQSALDVPVLLTHHTANAQCRVHAYHANLMFTRKRRFQLSDPLLADRSLSVSAQLVAETKNTCTCTCIHTYIQFCLLLRSRHTLLM